MLSESLDGVNDRDQCQERCNVCVSEEDRAEEQFVSGKEEDVRESVEGTGRIECGGGVLLRKPRGGT